MSIDAITDEVSDSLPLFDSPKTYLLPFSQIESALHINETVPSEISNVIALESSAVENLLESRGFKFISNTHVNAVVDPSGPILIYSDTKGNYLKSTPSHVFVQPGKQLERKKFFGLNGIGNSFQDAQLHALHLQKLIGGYEVNWLYCSTQSIPLDVAKAGASLLGHVSMEALVLQIQLREFHYEHIGDPEAKCFISCHSRGAIDVRNALQGLPQEVQKRVIVVAIAPAVVVPKKLCYDSFNYASKNDPIPHLYQDWLGGLEFESSVAEAQYQTQYQAVCEENRRELILLESHPDSTGFGHEYQDPTYTRVIEHHATAYVSGNINMMPYRQIP